MVKDEGLFVEVGYVLSQRLDQTFDRWMITTEQRNEVIDARATRPAPTNPFVDETAKLCHRGLQRCT